MIKKQFSKFILVGLLSTTVNYLIFFIALHYFFINYLISSGIGFIAGVFAGFFLNKNWTFDSRFVQTKRIIISYFLVYIFSLALSLVFLKITVGIFHASPEIANLLAICLTTCTNFIGTKFYVFKK
jgi:putative flippase GtrA